MSELRTDFEDSVMLWDASVYSRSFLEREYPELLSYKQLHESLQEKPGRTIWNPLYISKVYLACFILFGILGAFLKWGAEQPLKALLIGIGLGLFVFLMMSFGHILSLLLFAPEVKVENGDLVVNRRSFPRHIKVELRECTWYLGKGKDDYLLPATLTTKAIILVLPPSPLYWKPRGVACGWSDEMRIIWMQFLNIAQIPKNH